MLALGALASIGSATADAESSPPARPISLIFDTDMGNDIDDALALGVIHALVSRRECELVAVTITKDQPLSSAFVDAVDNFYGRGEIPIGVVRRGPTPEASRFTALADQLDEGRLRYPHNLKEGGQAPEAVALLRRTLAGARDGDVVIVQVGFSTNLARLLASGPDETSRLSGSELVRRKVRLLSAMAGAFEASDKPPQAEYNIKMDVASAQALVSKWPTPIVFSGFEVGLAVPYPAESIEQDFRYTQHHPLAEAYRLYEPPPHNRPTWDLTSVLYAVRPGRGYFDLSPPGRVTVTDAGITVFAPQAEGSHRYLVLRPEQRLRVCEALVQLTSQPPCAAADGTSPPTK